MRKFYTLNLSAFSRYVLLILTLFAGLSEAFAEGTKEVTPVGSGNVGMQISNISSVLAGPYKGANSENHLRFKAFTTEKFYFGIRAFDRPTAPGTPTEISIYYRILRSDGTVEVSDSLIPNNATAGRILNYESARQGPNGLVVDDGSGNGTDTTVTGGYTPIEFTPPVDGEYYIELYQSSDGGVTATTNQNIMLAFFDFTVVNVSTNKPVLGRVFSQGWSLITFWLDEVNHNNNPKSGYPEYSGDITVGLQEAVFYGYNVDSTVSRITFHNFQPLAFVVYFNKYGVDPLNTNWVTGRRSVSLAGAATTLSNGYPVFLNEPDVTLFPLAAQPLAPVVTGIGGCVGNYKINLTTSAPGDIKLFVDRNGNGLYDPGTADFFLYAYNTVPGAVQVSWDGKDGLGNPVTGGVSITSYASILRGRTNLPLFDAELNDLGISVEGWQPTYSIPTLYWDDSQLTSINNNPGSGCSESDATTFNNNTTGAGIDVSVEGASQEDPILGLIGNRGWDGEWLDGNSPQVPVTYDPAKGQSTLLQTCDDFGNYRILNTWFWSQEVQASSATFSTPTTSCALPVSLLQFNAEKRNATAHVTWVTASESNFREYVVERSLNGRDFTDLAHIAGRGQSRNTYSYDDNISTFNGARIYYRLRQVDIDNSYRYSRVVVLLTNVDGNLQISGLANPVRKDVRFQVSTTYAGNAEIRIADNTGRTVYHEQKAMLTGTNSVELARMPALAPGIYLLSVEINGERRVIKMMIND